MKLNRKDIGAYTATEAAHYLRVPLSTLRAWAYGQAQGQKRRFKSVITLPDPQDKLLSFNNLVEIYVLEAMRREHEVPLPKIRSGLEFVKKQMNEERPLLRQDFLTDGLSLFVEKSGLLVNVSQEGQLALKETLSEFLKRIDRDPKGIPIRLYPFTRHAGVEGSKTVVIDPEIAFGRPVLVGTSVPTANIFDRFLAGEPSSELAKDFRVDISSIEEAIRCEQIHQRTA